MKIPKNNNYPQFILDKSIEYCQSIGAVEITNIAILDNEVFRVMYREAPELDEKGNVVKIGRVWYKLLNIK